MRYVRHVLPVLLAASAGCSPLAGPQDGRPLEPVRGFTLQETQLAAASTAFGFELLAGVLSDEAEPNVLVSPLSASMALGMTMNGAAGATFTEMRDVLGFAGLSQSEINVAYRGLINQLRARDPKVEFVLANSVWHERSFEVKRTFTDTLRTYFDAEVGALDFQSASAVKTINDWAASNTGNRIRDLLKRIDPLEKLFLVNAVYFKAPWTHPFNEAGTVARPFRTAQGTTVQAQTMMRDMGTSYYSGDGVQLVELPYADTAFSMMVLAPSDSTRPLSSVVQRLTAAQWRTWQDRLQTGRLMLLMPKFRFDYGRELSDPLKRQGMVRAFDPDQADFSGINAQRSDLHITRVEQKTFIDVHELGTEAAAATAVGVGVTSAPPTVHFNRPFLFVIHERSSGAILFIGRVGDPTR